MPGNEDLESASFSESASPGALPLSPSLSTGMGTAVPVSGQEVPENGDDCLADRNAIPPPLGVKLTVYRMLNMTTLLSFGIIKGILAYMGKSVAPTTLDWVSGTLLAAVLYWIGLYEGRDSKKWEWLFQVDLAPAFSYCGKRVVGGILWPLLYDNSVPVFSSLGISLSSLIEARVKRSVSHMPAGASLGIVIGVAVFVLVLQYCVGALTPENQARNWAWQWARGLVEDYGPGAPLVEQHWWFGVVGTVVGLLCGIALIAVVLPATTVYFIRLT